MDVRVGMRFRSLDPRDDNREAVATATDGVTVSLKNETTGKVTKCGVGSFYPAGTQRSKGWEHLP